MERRDLDYNATAKFGLKYRCACKRNGDGWERVVGSRAGATRVNRWKARAQVAMLVGVTPNQVVFTSGGTEVRQPGNATVRPDANFRQRY